MRRDEALAFLDRVASGLALTFGPACEALVQEYEGGGLTVRSIYNGRVSGRVAGSTLSVYGTDTVVDDGGAGVFDYNADCVGMLATTCDGKRVKSSTWILNGDGYRFALGVNLDITALDQAQAALAGLARVGGELREQMHPSVQGAEVRALLDDELAAVGKPAESLTRAERVAVVGSLSERGFFDLQRSVPVVAERLGVSKCTVYNYLKEASAKGGAGGVGRGGEGRA